jgi:hypothetical protein
VLKHIKVVDGRIWLTKEGLQYFCGDLSATEQQLVWATQGAPAANIFAHDCAGRATPCHGSVQRALSLRAEPLKCRRDLRDRRRMRRRPLLTNA